MKGKYLIPFLFSMALSQGLAAQSKVEANSLNLDLKNKFVDVSLTNPEGIKDYTNDKGDIKIKFKDNALYFIRNGLLNHGYGGNMDVGLVGGYYNATDQSNKTEKEQTKPSPIGNITTKTTILEKNNSQDQGFILKEGGFFISYESALKENVVSGSTLVTINENSDLVPFSTTAKNNSVISGVGFENGFVKFIKNSYVDPNSEKDEEKFDNFLLKANYLFTFGKKNSVNLSLYNGHDVSDFSKVKANNVFGWLNVNVFRDINVGVSYDGKDKRFRLNLSTGSYSELNQRDFERSLENRLRLVPRIYDSNLETDRRYLEDMFFTKPLGYNFTLSKDEVIASLNLRNILLHYSKESQEVGLKYSFALGTYDFRQKEIKAGMFFR